MLLKLQSYLLTLLLAMLPSVTTQLAMSAASFNVYGRFMGFYVNGFLSI